MIRSIVEGSKMSFGVGAPKDNPVLQGLYREVNKGLSRNALELLKGKSASEGSVINYPKLQQQLFDDRYATCGIV